MEHYLCDLISKLLSKEPSQRPQSVREVKKHPWFSGINWSELSNKTYKAPFVPRDVMRAKYFKTHNKWPQREEDYIFDTRFFSPKQTKKDTTAIQSVVDKLQASMKKNALRVSTFLPTQRLSNASEPPKKKGEKACSCQLITKDRKFSFDGVTASEYQSLSLSQDKVT